MSNKKIPVIKTLIFTALLAAVFFGIQHFISSPDPRNYQLIRGFYEEPEDSLDAVFIGGSNVYSFFQPPAIWAAEGIKTAEYACNGNRMTAMKYFMEEVRKTQRDPLFIVVINDFTMDIKEDKVHYHTDYVPFSLNKKRMIDDLCSRAGITGLAKLEYLFPLIRYHSRWKELTKEDFHHDLEGLKGGSHYDTFVDLPPSKGAPIDPERLPKAIKAFKTTKKKGKIPEDTRACLNDLLDYCDENSLRVLFVHSPQLVKKEHLKVYNAMDKLIEERGYDTLNLCNHMEDIGYVMEKDYYNPLHNNVHGSMKLSKYFAHYLSEHYELGSPERDDPVWNQAWADYRIAVSGAATPEELDKVEN